MQTPPGDIFPSVSIVQMENIRHPEFSQNLQESSKGLGESVYPKLRRKSMAMGFEIANWQRALNQRKNESNRYYKDSEVSFFVDLNYFKIYGPGIYLFFRFLCEISLLFLLFSFISIVPIVINYLHGEAYKNSNPSLQQYISRGSIGNNLYSSGESYRQSIDSKIANVVVDILICSIFFVYQFYWEHRSSKMVKTIDKQIKLQSCNTVEVIEFPIKAKEKDIEIFMGQFGDIVEVAAARYYSDEISYFKQIYELQLQIKTLELSNSIDKELVNSVEIKRIRQKIDFVEKELDNQETYKRQIVKFYVQYETRQERDDVLKRFQRYQRCCSANPPDYLLLQGEQVKIKQCHTQPTGIIWQNAHISWRKRLIRSFLSFIVILLVVVIAFILIAIMNVILPPSKNNIDTSAYNYASIQGINNVSVVEPWCISNMKLGDNDLKQFCWQFWLGYAKRMAMNVGISLMIFVFRWIVKKLMIRIAKFLRYTSQTEESVAITNNLLITYVTTTVLITFLLQANVFKISFKSFIHYFISFDQNFKNNLGSLSEYEDLTSQWYWDIGYQIWFNLFLLTFIPHIFMPFIYFLFEKYGEYRAKDQKLYRKMYEHLKPAQFEIEDAYADILLIVLTGFVFGGGNAFMMITSFFCLISRYVYFKYIFIRYCRIPKTYDDSLNNNTLRVMQVVLMLRCLISLYMYGAEGIFAKEESMFHSWSSSIKLPFFKSIFIVISRLFLTWYYGMFAIFFILVFIFKDLIVDTFGSLCRHQVSENDSNEEETPSASQMNRTSMKSNRILTKSYKLQNNPDYFEILSIMKMREARMLTKNVVKEGLIDLVQL